MYNYIFFPLALVLIFKCQSKESETKSNYSEHIRINQIGYFTNGPKKFVVADIASDSFDIVNENGLIVHSGTLEDKGVWDKSGETVLFGVFTEFKQPGKYQIQLDNGETSYLFTIGADIYIDLRVAALKSYYLHRISMPIEEKYAGMYHRPIGHEDTAISYHSSTGKTGILDSPGGWYDAGDYGKYIVNAGFATGIMLALYEKYPDAYPDESLNIPESGNGMPDLLDELKYEIDWMLTMQDNDGGVFVKVTTLGFGGFVMPHEATEDRWVIGKSTGAALNLSAVCAMAARIYEPFNADFAVQCKIAAVMAWKWAMMHPEDYYDKNPEGVTTGTYSDMVLDEEFFWAAAELYITTGESEYFEYIQLNLGDISFRLAANWKNYNDNIGYFSLLGKASRLDKGQKMLVADGLIKLADELGTRHRNIPYQIPVDDFVWGSNSDFLDAAMIYANAYEVSKNTKYMHLAVETFDYIMGKNAVGYSFITGFGSKRAMRIHHRPSNADGIKDPYPGFVVGGPNDHKQDQAELSKMLFVYPKNSPAKAYVDQLQSYASNEIAINWNAPCVYMLGFFDAYKEEL